MHTIEQYSLDNILPPNERFGELRFKLQIESLLLNQQNNATLQTAYRHVNHHSQSYQHGKGVYRDNLEISIMNLLTHEKVEYFVEEVEQGSIPNVEIKYHHLQTLLQRILSKNLSKKDTRSLNNVSQSLYQIATKSPIYLQISNDEYISLQQSDQRSKQEILKQELTKLIPQEQYILQDKFKDEKIQYIKKEDRASIIIINTATTFTPEEILRVLINRSFKLIDSKLQDNEHGQPLSQLINLVYDQNNRRNEFIKRFPAFRNNQFQVITNTFRDIYRQDRVEFMFSELLEIIDYAESINSFEKSLDPIVKEIVNRKQISLQKSSIQEEIRNLIKQWRFNLKQTFGDHTHTYFFEVLKEFQDEKSLDDLNPKLLLYEIHIEGDTIQAITFYQPSGKIVATFSFSNEFVGFAGELGQYIFDMPRKQYFRFKFAEQVKVEQEMQQIYSDFVLLFVSSKIKNRPEKDMDEEI